MIPETEACMMLIVGKPRASGDDPKNTFNKHRGLK